LSTAYKWFSWGLAVNGLVMAAHFRASWLSDSQLVEVRKLLSEIEAISDQVDTLNSQVTNVLQRLSELPMQQ